MTTQTEFFKEVFGGATTTLEPISQRTAPDQRLAQGQENRTGIISRPPMPAPASSLPPFARNSDTSRQAAVAKYDAGDAVTQRAKIYDLLCKAGSRGMIREEIETILNLDGNTVRPRLKELMCEVKGWNYKRAFVKRNGETRKTSKGRNAEVLEAT